MKHCHPKPSAAPMRGWRRRATCAGAALLLLALCGCANERTWTVQRGVTPTYREPPNVETTLPAPSRPTPIDKPLAEWF